MNRRAAGIGYGFLFGAGIGLVVGVLTRNLFPWAVAGAVAGMIIGGIAARVGDR